MPETPLRVGSKLELLLRAFVFAKFPYTSPYTLALSAYAFCRILYVYTCIILAIHNVHVPVIEAPRVLHFSAFIDN